MTKGTYSKIMTGLAVAGCVLLAALIFTAVWAWTHCVVVGWRFYPKDAASLDLRGRSPSVEQFDTLNRKLPGCEIVWDVPFQGGILSSDTRRISVSRLTDTDVDRLDYLTALEEVDGSQCRDFSQLVLLQQRHPDCTVLYRVPIRGTEYPQDTQKISLPKLTAEEAGLLEYLPNLTAVNAEGCTDYALLASLQEAHPQWIVSYTVKLGNAAYPSDSQSITAENATYRELSNGLVGLTKLRNILLRNPKANYEELTALRQEQPQVSLDWELEIDGQVYPSDIRELDLSFMTIDSVESAAEIASYFPELEKLIVDSGSIDNEAMAAFREEVRSEYKVVWTVQCGKIAVRTDETTFMPVRERVYYFHDKDAYNLRYCEDMVCIDVGHMSLHNIDFVQFMPHLKYLILAHSTLIDITPISSCKELVFLELDWTGIKDYTPLLGCTALEALNLGRTYGDPAPIKQMTWLKNLWWACRGADLIAEMSDELPNTHKEFTSTYTVGNGWRKLKNYYDMRDLLGMEYMN